MATRRIAPLALVAALLLMVACAPAAPPTPTPTKPPAAPTKAPEAAKPPAPTPTVPPAPTPTLAPVTLKHGSIQTASEAPVFIALEKGFFQEQGIGIEITNFSTSREMVAPLGTEKLDFISSPVGPAFLAAADRGIDLRIVAGGGLSRPKWETFWLLLRKDLADSGQVKTPAGLKGMTIANPSRGSLGEQAIQSMLEEANLKAGDVKVEELMFDAQGAAFANKAIALSATAEPFATRIVQEGLAVKWLPASKYFGGQFQSTFIVFGPGLAKNKEPGRRWMIAYLKGVRYYLRALTTGEGRDDVVSILAKHTPVKDPALYKAMEMPYLDPNGMLDMKSIDVQYKFSLDQGIYTGKKTFSDLIDTSFAEYAVQRLWRQ